MEEQQEAETRALILKHTEVTCAPLVPGVRLRLITAQCEGYFPSTTERSLPWEMPFWAFAWPGGQVLAQFLQQQGHLVHGKRVLNIGSGCGIESIVAAQSGAAQVTSNDIDPVAAIAGQLNAQLNEITLDFSRENRIGSPVTADVILAGDVWYSPELAAQMVPWLRQCARDSLVLVGDARRVPLPSDVGTVLWRADAPFDGAVGSALWPCDVVQLKPA